jgi:hypothetical protein
VLLGLCVVLVCGAACAPAGGGPTSTWQPLTGLLYRADMPVGSSVDQDGACRLVERGHPALFRRVYRMVPAAIPVSGFGPATAECGTDQAATGLYYTELIWTRSVPVARIDAYERALAAAGFIRSTRDSLYTHPNSSAVYDAPPGVSDISLAPQCTTCTLQTVIVETDRADGTVAIRWI